MEPGIDLVSPAVFGHLQGPNCIRMLTSNPRNKQSSRIFTLYPLHSHAPGVPLAESLPNRKMKQVAAFFPGLLISHVSTSSPAAPEGDQKRLCWNIPRGRCQGHYQCLTPDQHLGPQFTISAALTLLLGPAHAQNSNGSEGGQEGGAENAPDSAANNRRVVLWAFVPRGSAVGLSRGACCRCRYRCRHRRRCARSDRRRPGRKSQLSDVDAHDCRGVAATVARVSGLAAAEPVARVALQNIVRANRRSALPAVCPYGRGRWCQRATQAEPGAATGALTIWTKVRACGVLPCRVCASV